MDKFNKTYMKLLKEIVNSENKFTWNLDSYNDVKIGDTTISYKYKGNHVELASIRTPISKRNNGSARQAMIKFLDEVDRLGLPVILASSPLDKKTNGKRLFNFYQSLGFIPTGVKINLVGDLEMIRQPKR